MSSAHYDFMIMARVGRFSQLSRLRVDAIRVPHSQIKIDIGGIDINGG